MFTKADIFNFALGALLLSKEVSDPENDTTIYGKTLRKNWPIALAKTLADLDLDSTAEIVTLELVATYPNDLWTYAYKYPDNCALFRRIESGHLVDNRFTKIPASTGTHEGEKVIFTNWQDALASIQPTDLDFDVLPVDGIMALANMLAFVSPSLIVGKGANALKKEILATYTMYKAEAQENDRIENNNPLDPEQESEFVATRMS